MRRYREILVRGLSRASTHGEDIREAERTNLLEPRLAAAVLTEGHLHGLQLVTARVPWHGWSFHAFDLMPSDDEAGEALRAEATPAINNNQN